MTVTGGKLLTFCLFVRGSSEALALVGAVRGACGRYSCPVNFFEVFGYGARIENALRSELVKPRCEASWESGANPGLARSGEWGPDSYNKSTGLSKLGRQGMRG